MTREVNGRMRVHEQVDALRVDVSYGWRGLRRQRGFTLAAVLTVALCVGANTAIFGVVNAVLLQPLPYSDAGRLVMVWNHWTNWPRTWLAPPEAMEYATQRDIFASFGPYNSGAVNVTGDGEPDIRALAKKALSQDGHAVIEASGGREALALIEAQAPDL